MPHQCLKCGKIFPSGSPEILKGCSECGGRKFFYTQEALSEPEREELTQMANRDLKAVIHNVLSSKEEPRALDESIGGKKEWVEVKVDRPQTRREGTEKQPQLRDRTKPDWMRLGSRPGAGREREREKPSRAQELVEEAEKRVVEHKTQRRSEMHRSGKSAAAKAPQGRPERTAKPKPKPKSKPKPKLKPKQKPEPKIEREPAPNGEAEVEVERGAAAGPGAKRELPSKHEAEAEGREFPDHVGVIRVEEHGVYEIDLEGLLENSPVIVQRDGRYLIHLPSVFSTMTPQEPEKKRKHRWPWQRGGSSS